jgi:glycosyltransferase involved in cell wall biosynthesis
MKIIYIADVDLSEQSAPSVHVIQLCRQLAGMGHQVTVITAKPKCPLHEPQPFELVYIRLLNIRRLGALLFKIVLPGRLLYEIISSQADLIYERAVVSPIASYVSWAMRKPHVSELNGVPLRRKHPLLSIAGSLSSFLGLWHVDAIISTTQGYKSFAIREYGIPSESISVLPFGVDEELFRPRDRNMCASDLNLDPNKRYIGYVGSFYPKHDLPTLIRSLKIVGARFREVELLLVGDGWGMAECRRLTAALGLEKSVKFVGMVPVSVVPKYLGLFDIAVVPRTRASVETLGMESAKLPEYLACNCAVVATDLPGSETYESFRDLAYAVPPENPTAMADALIHLLSDADLRGRLGRNGRQYVLANRTWKQVAIQTLEIAEQVLKNRKDGDP